MEIVITYGYIILFSTAFTLTPLLALILAILEIRVDAWKLCYLTRRPYPDVGEDIGVWFYITTSISYFGIITNIAIVIFTAEVFDTDLEDKWLIFIVLEHALFAMKFLISVLIPDMPSIVTLAKIWGNRIVEAKMFNKLSDVEKERKAR
jgi:hypothetical protein